MATEKQPPLKSTTTDSHVLAVADSHLLKKSNVGELNIPELQDAKLADTPYSQQCTLILTQGISSKLFAMDGINFLGLDKYGMFPLEGELLNVREASHEDLEKNTDIQNIKKILGLEEGRIYENVKELRYGRLMFMTDEDHDGVQMKGLLINFLHYFWPSLLKVENFLHMFIAPDVKATHKKTNKVFLFYSMPEYEAWKQKLGNEYNITYYKGQETIKSEEREEFYFDQHVKDFVWVNDKDGDAIELAFSNMKIEERKRWLEAPEDVTDFDPTHKCIRYLDFINHDFKQYATADLERSIPSLVDGLKPRQRKVLFYAFRKPIIEEIGVGEFSGYVLEQSPYHQGDASLVSTIIGMAQKYVGSNNINLLKPSGQFGTRWMGGKDHADGRFLYTKLSPITQYLFHKDDGQLLNYLNEDGQLIEPAWFIPIIPMVLVNGSEARGALSSFIPNYNPRDIIANLKRLLIGEEMVPMLPWYKGFKGDIEESASTLYTTKGTIIIEDDKNALTITELPLRTWTEDYKDFLDATSDIKDYEAHYHDTGVDFEITMTEDQMNKARQEGFLKKFKLTTTLNTANMYLFDAKGKLKKYNTPEQILEDFFHFRLDFYGKRRTVLLRELKKASMLLENKMRYIREVWEGNIVFSRNKDERCASLEAQGFDSLPEIESKVDLVLRKEMEKEEEVAVGEEKPQGNAREVTRYDYLLLSTPAASMEYEDLEELKKEKDAKDKEFELLRTTNTTSESLWLTDLKALDDQLLAEGYPEAKYTEAEKAKLARDAAGQSANKKRRMHAVSDSDEESTEEHNMLYS